MIRACVATSLGSTGCMLGDHTSTDTVVLGTTQIFLDKRHFEDKWQYSQPGNAVIDLTSVFEKVIR